MFYSLIKETKKKKNKQSRCATALATGGAYCRNVQTKKRNNCVSPLPSLFSRIWTVSPISRMRAWHIGDRKLQITVREKKEEKKKMKHTIKIGDNKYISPRYYSFHIGCWAAGGNYIARQGSSLLLFSCGGAQVPPLHCQRCGVAAATFLFLFLLFIYFF